MVLRLRHTSKPWIVGVLLLVIMTLAATAAYVWLSSKQAVTNTSPESSNKSPNETQIEKTKIVRFAMMGDMLAHDSVNAQAKTADGYNYAPYFASIRPLYKDADIVFCNPETPVAGDTLGVSGYPTFNAPGAFARDLVKAAGCNVIALASNHAADKGQAGIDASRAVWVDQQPYAYNGANSSVAQQELVAYFTVKGVKFAFLSFADYSNAALPNSYSLNSYHNAALVEQLMGYARRDADVVIVSAHWGVEDLSTVSADQKAAAQLFVDQGATVVVGTGPHVEQEVAWLTAADGRKVPVWYSIGNMLSSQLGIDGLTSGVAQLDFRMENNVVTVENLAFAPTFMSYDWSDADRAAGLLLKRGNLQLRPLDDANASIRSMFGTSYSVAERRTYLERALNASASQVTVR